MKNKQWILIGITAAFLCLLVGIFVGRNLTGSYIPLDKVTNSQSSENTSDTVNYDGKIDINTATAQQLQLLPGVGEATAEKIIQYRESTGGFSALEEIMNVSGIGEKKFQQMKPFIKITTDNS